MRIILYNGQGAKGVSGVTTFEKRLIELLKDKHELFYCGKNVDKSIYDLVEVIDNKEVECDICIYTSIFKDEPKIKADKYIQVVHTDLHHWGISYNPEGIDLHVAVGSGVQKSLEENNGINSILIPNPLGKVNTKKVLRFMYASRLSRGKGLEKLGLFIDKLKEKGVLFIIEVYGDGVKLESLKKQYPEVHFMGRKDDIQSYMLASDYVIQFSDNEGFCYSIYEALQVGVPVIVTDWEGVRDAVVDGENGFICKQDLSDLDVDKIYKGVEVVPCEQGKSKWLSLLETII